MIEYGKKSEAAEVSAKLARAVVGTRPTAVERSEVDWLFSFDAVWEARTPTYWRLIVDGGITVSGDDDGHLFGRPEPVDAVERVRQALRNPVSGLEISETTADLRVHFGSDRLELLNTSSGYEGWALTVHDPKRRGWLVSLGGGGVAGTI